jgi:transcriptional regulator with XRE-family HTH domain
MNRERGIRIRDEMIYRGIELAEVARRLKVTTNQVQRWRQGAHIRLEHAIALCALLRVRIRFLEGLDPIRIPYAHDQEAAEAARLAAIMPTSRRRIWLRIGRRMADRPPEASED